MGLLEVAASGPDGRYATLIERLLAGGKPATVNDVGWRLALSSA
jgi:hypothetical protein